MVVAVGESAGVMFALLIGHRSRFGNAAERQRERERERGRENNIEKYDTLVSVVRYARCESRGERERERRIRAREAEKRTEKRR